MKTAIHYNMPGAGFKHKQDTDVISRARDTNPGMNGYCNTCLRNTGSEKNVCRNTWYAAKEYPVLGGPYKRHSKRKSKSN